MDNPTRVYEVNDMNNKSPFYRYQESYIVDPGMWFWLSSFHITGNWLPKNSRKKKGESMLIILER